jgi:hypothetical protein
MEHLKRRKCKLRNDKTLEVEQLRWQRYRLINHKTLEEGVRKRNNQRELKNKDRWRLCQQ